MLRGKYRLLAAVAIVALVCVGATSARSVRAGRRIPESKLSPAPYATWAHSHQVWISSGQSNQTTVVQLLKDYLAHDLPVGGVDIDSQWSTSDNNFVFDTKKYPDAQGMVNFIHSQGVRVILWVTSFLNTDAPTYAYAKSKNFFLNDGKVIKWWHGLGSLIDYTNPDAVEWWHQQIDIVLNMGFDGFKCDGADLNIFEYGIAYGHKGYITHEEYANDYYRDFYYYPRSRNPEALIWARPCDSYGSPFCLQFAPRDVMHSGWVGDQRGNWDGLKAALFNLMQSAFMNYANYGSDIGGYLNDNSVPAGRTKEVFVRWFQMGTFNPHMENGGNGEHRPWMFDAGTNGTEVMDIYRLFVQTHQELIPYLLNAGTVALASNHSVLLPMSIRNPVMLTSYDFKLSTDIFVCPITDGNVTGHARQVTFPDRDNWIDWWNPQKVYKGATTIQYPIPDLHAFPVFKRQGSVIPINVTRDYTGHGSRFSDDAITLLVNGIDLHRKAGSAIIRGEMTGDTLSQEITYKYDTTARSVRISATAHPRKLLVLMKSIQKCSSDILVVDRLRDVEIASIGSVSSGKKLTVGSLMKDALEVTQTSLQMQKKLRDAQTGFWFDADRSELWVRSGSSKDGMDLEISCVENI